MEHIFKQLGHKCKRVRSSTAASSQRLSDSAPDGPRAQSDIEDMIWEVDDDCDRKVTWPEFQSMFARCRNDKTGASLLTWRKQRPLTSAPGYEPRRLYNVAEFLMNDKDGNGNVRCAGKQAVGHARPEQHQSRPLSTAWRRSCRFFFCATGASCWTRYDPNIRSRAAVTPPPSRRLPFSNSRKFSGRATRTAARATSR